MKFGKFSLCAALMVSLISPIAAQTASPSETSPSGEDRIELSSSYRNITLGSSMEEVKKALLADTVFGYRGDRDVSLLHGENRTLIETTGMSFIKRSWFQFDNDRLYVMTFSLDTDRIDYYSVYSTLVDKYGEPSELNPRLSRWNSGGVVLSLERPLLVKYIDEAIFSEILEKSGVEKAASDVIREGFLDEF
ncbi:hypothetical protein K7J14_03210 [Treponema zuelzerae]|uniref:Uncharacterized protein n=1 Tax=Teretinema zuelzerae TaxID=156 RepID=A0AAE3EH79_9SPIR|nr:hypothetical protein [Teretinema zuelzerae]MCD1653706.1 hypothetical protein [Teretinema zuelzerae]